MGKFSAPPPRTERKTLVRVGKMCYNDTTENVRFGLSEKTKKEIVL
jgi:hypothetical protein